MHTIRYTCTTLLRTWTFNLDLHGTRRVRVRAVGCATVYHTYFCVSFGHEPLGNSAAHAWAKSPFKVDVARATQEPL